MKLTLETNGFKALEREFSTLDKVEQLATLFAANRVASLIRTQVVKAIRVKLGVSAKSVRKRTRLVRATRRAPRAKLWLGTKIGIPLYEGGTQNRGVRKLAGPNSFEATMRSGHRGLFYRPGPTWRKGTRPPKRAPILEHRLSLKGVADPVMWGTSRRIWDARYENLYWNDLNRRLARRGWK